MASPVFIKADRDDPRVKALLAAVAAQTPATVLTPAEDRAPDDRFELNYAAAGVDHPSAVEHLVNWMTSYDPSWGTYVSIGLPGGGWS
jgi:hypothetical protein